MTYMKPVGIPLFEGTMTSSNVKEKPDGAMTMAMLETAARMLREKQKRERVLEDVFDSDLGYAVMSGAMRNWMSRPAIEDVRRITAWDLAKPEPCMDRRLLLCPLT